VNIKNILYRKPLINAKFLLLSLTSFVTEKKHVAMQKLFKKKIKNGQVSKNRKKGSKGYLPKKERKKKRIR
jgi:hypothetical protein